jgi:hypothetical protein
MDYINILCGIHTAVSATTLFEIFTRRIFTFTISQTKIKGRVP